MNFCCSMFTRDSNIGVTKRKKICYDDVRGEYETRLDPLPTTSAAKLTVEGARKRGFPPPLPPLLSFTPVTSFAVHPPSMLLLLLVLAAAAALSCPR